MFCIYDIHCEDTRPGDIGTTRGGGDGSPAMWWKALATRDALYCSSLVAALAYVSNICIGRVFLLDDHDPRDDGQRRRRPDDSLPRAHVMVRFGDMILGYFYQKSYR